MMMLPDPTEVIPTKKPATKPIADMPAKDFMVGGRFATCSSIRRCRSSSVGTQTSKSPTAEVMKVLTPVP